MATTKKVLARNLPFSIEANPLGDRPVFLLGLERRKLLGEVGYLITALANGRAGKVVFLDKRPAHWYNAIQVIGTVLGIAVVHGSKVEFVVMCHRFRNRIVGGVGKVRYATVKGIK